MFESIKKPLVLLLAFFICLFLYTKLAGPLPFAINSVTTTKSNVFHAEGTGKVVAVPDTAEISFGVTKTASTVADAQNQTNTVITAVTDALKKQGIEEKDMKTTNYTVSPNYDYTNGKQTLTGYTVNQNIDVKIKPLEKANQVMDILTQNGANIVNQVSFTFSDDKRKELENQARKLAVDEAKTKAQSLAAAAGIHLGPVIDVEEQAENAPGPVPLAMAKDGLGAGGTPTQLTPGENSISLTVTLSYETY